MTLNWNRSQYFFVLNVAVLAAAFGLLSTRAVPVSVDIVLFLAGAVIGAISVLATDVQHSYYRNARDLKQKIENKLELGEYAIATTQGQGGIRTRIAKVQTFQKSMLVVLVLANVAGVTLSTVRALRGAPAPKVEVVIRLRDENTSGSTQIVIVQNDRIAATARSYSGSVTTLEVRRGPAEVDAVTDAMTCTRQTVFTASPLQSVAVSCH